MEEDEDEIISSIVDCRPAWIHKGHGADSANENVRYKAELVHEREHILFEERVPGIIRAPQRCASHQPPKARIENLEWFIELFLILCIKRQMLCSCSLSIRSRRDFCSANEGLRGVGSVVSASFKVVSASIEDTVTVGCPPSSTSGTSSPEEEPSQPTRLRMAFI